MASVVQHTWLSGIQSTQVALQWSPPDIHRTLSFPVDETVLTTMSPHSFALSSQQPPFYLLSLWIILISVSHVSGLTEYFPFITGLFHLVQCPCGSCTLDPVSEFPSLLNLSHIHCICIYIYKYPLSIVHCESYSCEHECIKSLWAHYIPF